MCRFNCINLCVILKISSVTISVFSKIYSYRERENKNSKENFLIEILAHCLETDEKLLKDFLEIFDLKFESEISIETQSIYDYGRPDLEINLANSKTCILIECKIEHHERENQLEDYKKILLEKKVKKRHLVYLTKYYEHRDNNNKNINFVSLKWSDIYDLIDGNNNKPLTLELKSYLKGENMDESKSFNYNDISALLNISSTIHKMDEVIDSIKDHYQNEIGNLSKASSRSTRMKHNWYANFHSISRPNVNFEIQIGFFWWWDDVYIGVRVWLSRASKYEDTERYYKLFSKHLKHWEPYDDEKEYTFGSYKLVNQFLVNETLEEIEQIPKMREHLKACIDKLASLKKIEPNIFN